MIEFYLDFISPFGYLARARLIRIAAEFGLDIGYHPLDIGRIKRAAGNDGPSNRDIPKKLAYLKVDYLRSAERYGVPMAPDLAGPETSRMNRAVYLAQGRGEAGRYVEEAWACVWRDGLDPGADRTLAELEQRMGWSAGTIAAFAETDTTKARYDAEHLEASRRGVFGVPTFMIGDTMWWGNDRLDYLADHLAHNASSAAQIDRTA